MDKVNEYLKNNYKEPEGMFDDSFMYPELTKRVVCKDGFSVSIQADRGKYCTPRANKAWPYSEVELGFPNQIDELIEDYSEEPGNTETVYGYVPIEVVNALIDKHGGIVE